MGILYRDRTGPGIEKDAPPAKGLRLFFQILFREFFTLFKVNCLFLLFSIPVITIPAAYCAMAKITASMVRDRPCFLWSDYLQTFRSELKKATAAGLILSGGLAVACTALWFYGGLIGRNALYWLPTSISGMVVITLLFVGFSAFPMIALIDLPLKDILKNALLLAVLSSFYYIPALAVCAALLLAGLYFFPLSLPLVVLFYPAFFNLLTTFSASGGIERYVTVNTPASGKI